MKKFGISMAVIIGFIVVFTVSGLLAFHSFPENDKKAETEQAVGANMFSDEDPYLNSNNSILTIITPSTDKAKTTVRYGTADEIIVYEKNIYSGEIDVGEVEAQKSIFDEPVVRTETAKKETETTKKETQSEKKETEKAEEAEKKEEATESVKTDSAEEKEPEALENTADGEVFNDVSQDEVENEPPEEVAEEEAIKEEAVEEQPVEEEKVQEEQKAPVAMSLPPSMTGGTGELTLDPNKHYSDTGI